MNPNAVTWTIQMLEGSVEIFIAMLKQHPDLTDANKAKLYQIAQDFGSSVVKIKQADK